MLTQYIYIIKPPYNQLNPHKASCLLNIHEINEPLAIRLVLIELFLPQSARIAISMHVYRYALRQQLITVRRNKNTQ